MRYANFTLLLSTLLIILSACDSSDKTNNATTQRLVETTRSFSNGSTDVITTEYTASGNILRQTFSRDTETYLTTIFESSDDGRFIRRSEDSNQDGVEDSFSTYVYTDGLGLSRINRIRSNMLIDEIDLFQFENSLAMTRDTRNIDDVATSELVDESSGTLETRRVYIYENNRITSTDIDTNGDGEVDRQTVFSYNPDGTLATTVLSSLSEGVISSSSYVYEQGVCNNNSGNSSTSYFCVVTD